MGIVRRILLGGLGLAVLVLVVTGAAVGVRALLDHPAGSAAVLSAVGIVLLAAMVVLARVRPAVTNGTVLELDLSVCPPETASTHPLAALTAGRTPTLGETVDTLRKAARDKRVAALVVRPAFSRAPLAAVQELSAAIAAFRAAGKMTVAVVDTFGDGGPANSSYVLAAACEEVAIHPSGLVGLTPLAVEPNFYRGMLDRLGVQVDVFARYEYKNFANQLIETGFTGPHREAEQRLLDSLWEQVVDAVSTARRLDPKIVRALADDGPLLANDAMRAGLVDRVAYTDEVIADLKGRVGPHAKLLGLAVYAKKAGRRRERGKSVRIAVVAAAGEINRTQTTPVGLTGGPVLAADHFTTIVRKVAADKKTKAVVLRIDSPGGSAVASDTMWRELVRVKQAGKPIVVSMASVAASGGYYIAAPADRIVAERATITGSIGVVGLRPIYGEAKAKLGIVPDELHTGSTTTPFSVNRPLTADQRQRENLRIDEVYNSFIAKVADGRHKSVEEIDRVARGRVWTGADAAGIGLVDDLGGLETALAVAVELTGAAPGTRADVRPFPKKESAVTRLRRKRPQSSEDIAALAQSLLAPTGIRAQVGFDPRTYWIR